MGEGQLIIFTVFNNACVMKFNKLKYINRVLLCFRSLYLYLFLNMKIFTKLDCVNQNHHCCIDNWQLIE